MYIYMYIYTEYGDRIKQSCLSFLTPCSVVSPHVSQPVPPRGPPSALDPESSPRRVANSQVKWIFSWKFLVGNRILVYLSGVEWDLLGIQWSIFDVLVGS